MRANEKKCDLMDINTALISIVVTLLIPIIIIIEFALAYFIIKTLYFCIKNEEDQSSKVKWILIIIFTSGIGALIYHIFRKPEIEEKVKLKRQIEEEEKKYNYNKFKDNTNKKSVKGIVKDRDQKNNNKLLKKIRLFFIFNIIISVFITMIVIIILIVITDAFFFAICNFPCFVILFLFPTPLYILFHISKIFHMK